MFNSNTVDLLTRVAIYVLVVASAFAALGVVCFAALGLAKVVRAVYCAATTERDRS